MEVWRNVSGYEDSYQVSNLGNIRSKARISQNGHFLQEKMLSAYPNNNGYLQVKLTKGRNFKTGMVHILVANAFVLNPHDKPYVNHKNGIRDDNRIVNLEWVTATENMKHAYDVLNRKTNSEWMKANNPQKGMTGAKCVNSKKVYQYDMHGKFIREWESASTAQRELGISHVSCACLKKNKVSGLSLWSYEKLESLPPYSGKKFKNRM